MRGDSFPDSDVLVNQDQRQVTESNQTTRVVGHSYQHRVGDGVGSENRSKAAQNEDSCIVPIDSDPGDDTKGKERCDKDNCTLFYYPVTEQIVSQPTSTSLSTVLSQATPGFQPTSKLCFK